MLAHRRVSSSSQSNHVKPCFLHNAQQCSGGRRKEGSGLFYLGGISQERLMEEVTLNSVSKTAEISARQVRQGLAERLPRCGEQVGKAWWGDIVWCVCNCGFQEGGRAQRDKCHMES